LPSRKRDHALGALDHGAIDELPTREHGNTIPAAPASASAANSSGTAMQYVGRRGGYGPGRTVAEVTAR